MKNTKSVVNDFVGLQNQIVEAIVDSTKKVQDSIGKPEVFEKTTEVYHEWLAKQQEIASTFVGVLKNQLNFDAAPAFVKEVLDAQESFGKSWFEALRSTLKSKSTQELSAIYNENLKKAQENINQIYGDITQGLSKPVTEAKLPTVDSIKDSFKKLLDMWKPVQN
ncbi:MAG TPA: hypothetical protein DCM08_02965 [Microscillaceae bacterium]|jgi:hypothetical protein|nr:hypothetical protein [Microscillaceae bacterium]